MFIQKIFVALYLGFAGVILAETMVAAADIGARGHLPWPLAQWALTTPLGVLAVAVVGGLVWGLPALLFQLTQPLVARPVDVTELPLIAWPHSVSPWRAPGGRALADAWLGSGSSQRARSLLTFAFTALLLIGLIALLVAAVWYESTHHPHCGAAGCPPTFTVQFTGPAVFISLAVIFLGQLVRMAHVERRCGVWFRMRTASGPFTYIRRPGVTSEAAAAALQRYTRDARRPLAGFVLKLVLAMAPLFLMLSAGELLSVWLSTQWIPA